MRLLHTFGCLALAGMLACAGREKKKELPVLPPGYDVQKIEKIKLGEDLDEISGIWLDPSGSALFAENDEEGRIYRVNPSTGKIYEHTTFNSGGDFEDLTRDGTNWYMMRSNGNLFRITGAFTDSVKSETFKLHLPGYNNFEAACFVPADKKIYLVCKQCEADSGQRISIHAFNTVTSTYDPGPALTMVPDRTLLPQEDSAEIIKPSALAIHPVTGEWYLMASVNHLLIVAEPNGKWKKVYPLNKEWFKQPEGMSFAPNGDLYVSNEARSGTPNIIKVPWKGAN